VTIDQQIHSSLDKKLSQEGYCFSKKNQSGKILFYDAVKEILPTINMSLTGGNL
jgi:hypothetical protein